MQPLQGLRVNNNLVKPVEQSQGQDLEVRKNLSQVERLYDESWIVLQNRLLNAITNLDLNERRLVMFLSPIVRKTVDKDPHQRKFVVKVKDFVDKYKINSHSYYQELKHIGRGLQDKSFVFWDFSQNSKEPLESAVSWIGKSTYRPKLGEIEIVLLDDVVEMLTVFDKANPYTKYQREMIVNLGCYGLVLFELIASCMYQNHKQKAYTIEYLREKFNCTHNYKKISDFKYYVIDKAITDVEAHTPYRISYTQKKQGRRVAELVFSFQDTSVVQIEGKNNLRSGKLKKTKQSNNDNLLPVKPLTDKQRFTFSKKLARLPELSYLATGQAGQDYDVFAAWIAKERIDPERLMFYIPYLKKVGFGK